MNSLFGSAYTFLMKLISDLGHDVRVMRKQNRINRKEIARHTIGSSRSRDAKGKVQVRRGKDRCQRYRRKY